MNRINKKKKKKYDGIKHLKIKKIAKIKSKN